MVVAWVSDLMFQGKISAVAAGRARFVRRQADFERLLAENPGAAGVVDLAAPVGDDPAAVLAEVRRRFPDRSLVAFGSHVLVDLLKAVEAGGWEVTSNAGFSAGIERFAARW